ncbi:hypothetical protein [Sulfuricurvum sp.]|uniref:hypothetical protein n=1 Tax=Sulfuricurvum sp. TaxID=2025608 RepID=UPI00356A6381
MIHRIYYNDEIYIIDLNNFDSMGCYGRVFVNEAKNKAIKMFYIASEYQDNLQRKEHVCKTFKNEINAYKLLSSNTLTLQYIPTFYGEVTVEKVEDGNGRDVLGEYYSLAYSMEFIQGRFDKIENKQFKNLSYIKDEFKKLGVENTRDASVIHDNDTILKIIDFSTQEIVYQI